MNKRLQGFRTEPEYELGADWKTQEDYLAYNIFEQASNRGNIQTSDWKKVPEYVWIDVYNTAVKHTLAIIREIVEEKKQSKPMKKTIPKRDFVYKIYNEALDDILAELK